MNRLELLSLESRALTMEGHVNRCGIPPVNVFSG
jgi:hypothetical protein